MRTIKNPLALLRYFPRKTAIVSFAALAVIVPAASFAYGPSRPTYTFEKPATHVTFDSITDNPEIGDERNFVGIRDASAAANTTYSDSITVTSGHTYLVRMYVHNDAAQNLNLVAHNVTAKFNLPTTTAKSIDVFGYIDSSNASPKEVYDQATFKSSQNFNLAVVDGSLTYENNHFTSGTKFSNEADVFTSKGVKLGYDKLNGDIPGCLQYAGYLTFEVKPQFAATTTTTPTPKPTTSFTMSKQVSKHGANQWVDNYTAQPGETVDFLVNYKNTGTTQQDNVVLKDALPAGMTYVSGSTTYGNANHPSGTKATDTITGQGINVGSYKTNSNAYAIFSATVPQTDALKCGQNILTDTATVTTDSGSKNDTAKVTVNKTCTTPVTPTQPTTPETPAQPQTPEQPEQPAQPAPTPLPSTGPSDIIGAGFGVSSLGLGAHYYLTSRRAVRTALGK